MFYSAASSIRSLRPFQPYTLRRSDGQPSKRLHLVWPLLLSACGAVSELDPNPPPKQGSPSSTPAPATPSASATSSPRPAQGTLIGAEPMDGVDWPTFELGECVLGERPSTLSECRYMGDGRCYRNVAMACSCVCPEDVDSFCFEGIFPNEWNAIDVSCTAK